MCLVAALHYLLKLQREQETGLPPSFISDSSLRDTSQCMNKSLLFGSEGLAPKHDIYHLCSAATLQPVMKISKPYSISGAIQERAAPLPYIPRVCNLFEVVVAVKLTSNTQSTVHRRII